MYIVMVTMIPLKGCQKAGNETRNQYGSIPSVLAQFGNMDLVMQESIISRQSVMAKLNEIKSNVLKPKKFFIKIIR